jgi:hypothetical protein
MKNKKTLTSNSKRKKFVVSIKLLLLILSVIGMSVAYFICLNGTFTHWPIESAFNSYMGEIAGTITIVSLPILLLSALSLVPKHEDLGIFE